MSRAFLTRRDGIAWRDVVLDALDRARREVLGLQPGQQRQLTCMMTVVAQHDGTVMVWGHGIGPMAERSLGAAWAGIADRERLALIHEQTAALSTRSPWPLGSAHAYTPRETGTYGGVQHLLVLDHVEDGRFRRSAGDALCKPRASFWGLDRPDPAMAPADCHACLDRLERLLSRLPAT